MNLRASASGWIRPNGPRRVGPGRGCIRALPRRSTQTMIGTTLSMNPSITAILSAVSRRLGLILGHLREGFGRRVAQPRVRLGNVQAGAGRRQVAPVEAGERRHLGGE